MEYSSESVSSWYLRLVNTILYMRKAKIDFLQSCRRIAKPSQTLFHVIPDMFDWWQVMGSCRPGWHINIVLRQIQLHNSSNMHIMFLPSLLTCCPLQMMSAPLETSSLMFCSQRLQAGCLALMPSISSRIRLCCRGCCLKNVSYMPSSNFLGEGLSRVGGSYSDGHRVSY